VTLQEQKRSLRIVGSTNSEGFRAIERNGGSALHIRGYQWGDYLSIAPSSHRSVCAGGEIGRVREYEQSGRVSSLLRRGQTMTDGRPIREKGYISIRDSLYKSTFGGGNGKLSKLDKMTLFGIWYANL